MGLRSPRMLGFSPIVIWTKRWCYSIVFPPFFAIRGQGVTSSTTWRRCCANRYTVDWLAMKMSTMPIVYRWIRLCGGSPGRRWTRRRPPAPTPWVDLRPRCCPVQGNLKALSEVNGRWVERALEKTTHRRIILDMDSSASPVHGEQEASAYNGHFRCTCYHPLFCFNQFGDCEGAMLRPGNVHSADGWKEMLPLPSRTFMNTWRRRAFCMPSGFLPTRCFSGDSTPAYPACGPSAPKAYRLVCRFPISSRQLGLASPGDCQGRVASRRTLSEGGFHRHQYERTSLRGGSLL